MDIRRPYFLAIARPFVAVNQQIPILLETVIRGQAIALLQRRRHGIKGPGSRAERHGHQRGNNLAADPFGGLGRFLEMLQAVFPYLAQSGLFQTASWNTKTLGSKPIFLECSPSSVLLFSSKNTSKLREFPIVHCVKAQLADLVRNFNQGISVRGISGIGVQPPETLAIFMVLFLL